MSLKVVDGSGFVNLIIGGDATFEEMYRKGYLTGQALKDAEKKFGKLETKKFRW